MESCCSPESCDRCPARLVCRCLQVTEDEIRQALALDAVQTVHDLRRLTGAGDGCTACRRELELLIDAHYSSICSVR